MTENPDRHEPEDLSLPEKILRVQDLWDEIARTPQAIEMTPAQRQEAERRLLDHERSPRECSSWEDVRRRLENRR
jgi:putative addiction module component (TIGR02574 family)